MDRLGNCFLNDLEIKEFRKQVRTSKWYKYNSGLELTAKHIMWLELWSVKGNTGKVMVVATEDVQDTLDEIQEEWDSVGITPRIGGVSKLMQCTDELMDSLMMVLDASNYSYETKWPSLLLAEQVYNSEAITTLKGLTT